MIAEQVNEVLAQAVSDIDASAAVDQAEIVDTRPGVDVMARLRNAAAE